MPRKIHITRVFHQLNQPLKLSNKFKLRRWMTLLWLRKLEITSMPMMKF